MDAEDLAEAEDMLSKAKKPNKVIVKIECRDLLDIELISKSDPYAVLYLRGEKEKNWRRIGRTETQKDNLDPQFDTEFKLNYYFEKS
jgi:hypothetical protein